MTIDLRENHRIRPSRRIVYGFSLAFALLFLGACSDGDPVEAQSACVPFADPSSATDNAALLAILNYTKAAHGLNAIIFSASIGGKPVLTTAIGESVAGVPATTDMHFRVGMPAEQFETMLMLKLAEEGRLDLDAPVSKWFPDYPHADVATVRMLAASSAGFGDYVYAHGEPGKNNSFAEVLYANPHRQFSTADLIAYSEPPYQDPQFSNPGGSWAYSHTDFVVLGSILESAGAGAYNTLMHDKILSPLSLRDTAYASTAEIRAPVLRAFTSERGQYEESTDWSPSWTSYSGSLNSNVCDLTAWARAFGTGALLTPGSTRQITATTNVGLGQNTPALYFGLGVIVNNGWLISSGNFFGWHTATAYYKPRQIALALTFTEGPGTTDANTVSTSMLRRMSQVMTPEAPITLP
ncbi:serine hydrolase [Paraburkholderia sp. A1RI-2L]|uniref:serine hydrolase domain-containing protein n=1 Tax=Paraburkholderia sp. A1RI-2L TaxID=3028367 RepID=UPI003B7B9E01